MDKRNSSCPGNSDCSLLGGGEVSVSLHIPELPRSLEDLFPFKKIEFLQLVSKFFWTQVPITEWQPSLSISRVNGMGFGKSALEQPGVVLCINISHLYSLFIIRNICMGKKACLFLKNSSVLILSLHWRHKCSCQIMY